MTENNPHLFVYGTLLDEKNEFGYYLRKSCDFLCAGKFNGKLYYMGAYPGAVAHRGYHSWVFGKVFYMKEPENILKILDAYEGFGEEEQQPNLFVREEAGIETEDKIIQCWIYLYNLPVDGLMEIVSGNYLER